MLDHPSGLSAGNDIALQKFGVGQPVRHKEDDTVVRGMRLAAGLRWCASGEVCPTVTVRQVFPPKEQRMPDRKKTTLGESE
jgi:hypothetical protein